MHRDNIAARLKTKTFVKTFQINFLYSSGVGQKCDVLNDPVVASIAGKHGKTAAQVLLRFLIQQDIVVIPKSVTASRIQQNIDLFGFSLSTVEMGQLNALDQHENGRSFTWRNRMKG